MGDRGSEEGGKREPRFRDGRLTRSREERLAVNFASPLVLIEEKEWEEDMYTVPSKSDRITALALPEVKRSRRETKRNQHTRVVSFVQLSLTVLLLLEGTRTTRRTAISKLTSYLLTREQIFPSSPSPSNAQAATRPHRPSLPIPSPSFALSHTVSNLSRSKFSSSNPEVRRLSQEGRLEPRRRAKRQTSSSPPMILTRPLALLLNLWA